MTIEIKVPQLPESVTDATLVGWHKKPGESVRRDENLVDLETDKVVLEVPAPASGTLSEIKITDGTTVTSGELLALLEEGDVVESAAPVKLKQADVPTQAADTVDASHKLSPAVRRLLDEHDLDATSVSGTGKDGRITKSDVMAYLKSHSDENVTPCDLVPALPTVGAQRTEQRVPMTRLRARIA